MRLKNNEMQMFEFFSFNITSIYMYATKQEYYFCIYLFIRLIFNNVHISY